MSTPELREPVREEVARQVNARMDDVDGALEAITESNAAIDRALEAISSAQKALSRSNTAIARAIQERQNA